ncbi:MAG: hypothetical protein ACLUKH_21045 [Flavonifractor plautii]
MIFTSEVCGVVLIAPFDKISRPPCSTIRFIVFLSLFFRCFSPFSFYHRTFSLTTERVKETFSYFSLTPFGYANFAPLITATLTVAIFLLSLFSLKKKGVLKALFVLSIITVVISLLPLMYGLNYYTLVGAFITVTLVIESILAKIQQK